MGTFWLKDRFFSPKDFGIGNGATVFDKKFKLKITVFLLNESMNQPSADERKILVMSALEANAFLSVEICII